LKQLQKEYPDQVRLVFKHYPLFFHPRARASADAASAVFMLGGNAAFWKFHDALLNNQQNLRDEQFVQWATEAGVDPVRFKAVYEAKARSSKVDEDIALAEKIGVTGTPAFRINGVTVSGAQPLEEFKRVIDLEIEEAKNLLARGVARGNLYKMRSDLVLASQAEARPEPPAPSPRQEEADKTVWKIPVLADDPVLGSNTAPVTIVMFSEFQCPFCKRVEATVELIRKTYGDKVRFVWKDRPLDFHQRAMPAAQFGRYVFATKGNAAFWAAREALFASAPALEESDLSDVAQKLNVNWAKAKLAIDRNQFTDRIERSIELADDFQARGTPHFFINGVRLAGAQPFENFKATIDEQLVRAEELAKTGVAKPALYGALVKDGREPSAPETKEVGPVDPSMPFRGNAKAPIVIQEWSDFQCTFCRRVQPTLAQLEKDFPGQIKLVFRHLPLRFHQDAPLAAEAAVEAFEQQGNAGFWKYHDKLFEAQGGAGVQRANLEAIAAELGLDLARFRAALDTRRHEARVAADAAAAASAGIDGTPGFVINRYFVSGAQSEKVFKRAIRRALADAKKPAARTSAH
jgi:protein-disulfide isomerase